MIKKNINIQDVLYRKELIDAVNDNIRNISLVLLALAVVLTFYLFCPDKQYHKTGYLLQTLPHSHHEVGRSELGIHPRSIPSKECMERDIGSHRCRFHIDGDRLLGRDVRTGIASGHHT